MIKLEIKQFIIFLLLIFLACTSAGEMRTEKLFKFYECNEEDAEFALILNLDVPKFEISEKNIFYLRRVSDFSEIEQFGHAKTSDDGKNFSSYGLTYSLSTIDDEKFKIDVAGYVLEDGIKKTNIENSLIIKFNKNLSLNKNNVLYRVEWKSKINSN